MDAKVAKVSEKPRSKDKKKDDSKVHKLSLKGSSRLVAEFVRVFFPGLAVFRLYLRENANFCSSNTLFTRSCTIPDASDVTRPD